MHRPSAPLVIVALVLATALGNGSPVAATPDHDATAAVPPLPACAYKDIKTRFQSLRHWRKTSVDTRLMVGKRYAPPDLVPVSRAGIAGSGKVRRLVIDDLEAMRKAAKRAGKAIAVRSAYRSYQDQVDTFAHWVRVAGRKAALKASARPGHSEHQLGTTIDFRSASSTKAPWDYRDWATTGPGGWMRANAWRYGFVMSYPKGRSSVTCYTYEPWHYRYVGRTLARRIRDSGLTTPGIPLEALRIGLLRGLARVATVLLAAVPLMAGCGSGGASTPTPTPEQVTTATATPVAASTGAPTTLVAASPRPLPACAYLDEPVLGDPATDWATLVLDTVFTLPEDFEPERLVDTGKAGLNKGFKVSRAMLDDLTAMAKAARADGAPLAVQSAYRSHAYQVRTFQGWVDQSSEAEARKVSARPGHSEHQLGTSLDLRSADDATPPWQFDDWAGTPAGAWLEAHAWQYGFVMSYPKGKRRETCYAYEPWHYRYVGRAVAAAIHESGLTPRRYLWETYWATALGR